MKLFLSILLAAFTFGCAHHQQQDETAQNPALNSRFPASDADSQDLTQMTNGQLLGYAGKNVLRITIACPVSAFTIVGSAVAETLPISSALASLGTEVGTGFKYNSLGDGKTATNYVGGAAVGAVVDLTKVGYTLLFEESPAFTDEAFSQAKASYPATKFLAQKFYSEEGNCGLAGRKLVDTLNEVQRRQAAK